MGARGGRGTREGELARPEVSFPPIPPEDHEGRNSFVGMESAPSNDHANV